MGDAGLVVVGASLAGLRAAESARRAGLTAPITLIGAEPDHPYDRPPLSKAFLAEPDVPVPTLAAAHDLRELDIETVLGVEASGVDLARREIVAGDRAVPFDQLVIATGSSPIALPGADGIDAVCVLRTASDAAVIRRHVHAGSTAVLIGAGFVGAEIASAMRARGAQVTIVESSDVPLERAVGRETAPLLAELHRQAGVDLRCGVAVEQVAAAGSGADVTLSDGTTLHADVVVVGIGARPNTAWLDGSGLTVDDGVVCDETLLAAPGVWAAGDVARWHNPLFGRSMRQQNWTSANEHGLAVGRNAADPKAAKAVATVPYFWSDWYGHRIQMVGVAGPDVRIVQCEGTWLALHRDGDRLVGALTLDLPRRIMKFRSLIAKQDHVEKAYELAATLASG